MAKILTSQKPDCLSTGPIQFDNDWPGFFVAAEDCLELRDVLRFLRESHLGEQPFPAMLHALEGAIERGTLGGEAGTVGP